MTMPGDDDRRRSGLGLWLHGGRRLGAALFGRTGARWAQPQRRIGRTALLAVLVAGGGVAAYAAAGESGALPGLSGDKAALETVVHDYILAHPEIIAEAMKKLEGKRVAALVDQNRPELETPYAGAWEGAAKPDVTLVAFMDYACGYCRASLPDMARLLQEDPKLRIVYHELPVITRGSAAAARVSLYAAESGHFADFHRAMYAQGSVEPDKILAAASKAGLDPAKAKAELANAGRDEILNENIKLAQALEASGTPIFVVGDQVFYGAIGYEALKDAIAKARRAG